MDDLLPWLLDNARAVKQAARTDFLWVRILDVAASLTARSYATADRLVLEVVDPLGLTGGRFALDASPDGVACAPTSESPDLTVPVGALGAAYLGGVRVPALHAAGWLDEHTPGAAARAGAMFAGEIEPWCNTWF